VPVTVSEAELQTALAGWVPRAEGGDFVAMAYVAIVLHMSNASCREAPNRWLRRAMVSDDPEFLINLGEELVIGTAIYRDLEAARDCFDRAVTYSELMGSYAMARFQMWRERTHALGCLERASALGHVPSGLQLGSLTVPKKGLRRRVLGLRYFPGLLRQTLRVFSGRATPVHWWRYRDVFPRGDAEIEAELGSDRRYHFPWARPSTFATFAAVCAKGTAPTLARGAIDGASLTVRFTSGAQA
jgi:hypothetical protein